MPKFINSKFITCDPGTKGTAYALWNEDSIHPKEIKLYSGTSQNWQFNRQMILFNSDSFFYYCVQNGYAKLYIEKPQFMESFKGITAARTDALFKLIAVYGGIIAFAEKHGISVNDVEIPKWKGQLDKDKVYARLERKLGKKFPDHVADAVGIGLYLKGEF